MTNISIPISLFLQFKDLHGESLAKEYFEVYEASHQALFEEVKTQSVQKKLELRDELSKELASKSDVALLKADIKADMAEFKAEMRADMAEFKAEMRADMAEFKAEMRADMAELKAEMAEIKADLRSEIAQSKNDLIKWLFGIILGATVAIIGTMLSVMKMGGG